MTAPSADTAHNDGRVVFRRGTTGGMVAIQTFDQNDMSGDLIRLAHALKDRIAAYLD